jgi:hypothetical protein
VRMLPDIRQSFLKGSCPLKTEPERQQTFIFLPLRAP